MKILTIFEQALVRLVEIVKARTGKKTYVIELVVVFLILALVALASGKGIIEWIGVFAVFFTFAHMSVADRLREREEARANKGEEVMVECFYKLDRYYLLKEVCWFAYFLLLGAWSALAGVIVFLLYGPWRRLWRKHHPLS